MTETYGPSDAPAADRAMHYSAKLDNYTMAPVDRRRLRGCATKPAQRGPRYSQRRLYASPWKVAGNGIGGPRGWPPKRSNGWHYPPANRGTSGAGGRTHRPPIQTERAKNGLRRPYAGIAVECEKKPRAPGLHSQAWQQGHHRHRLAPKRWLHVNAVRPHSHGSTVLVTEVTAFLTFNSITSIQKIYSKTSSLSSQQSAGIPFRYSLAKQGSVLKHGRQHRSRANFTESVWSRVFTKGVDGSPST